MILALLVALVVFAAYLAIDHGRVQKQRRQSLRARITPDGSSHPEYDDTRSNVDGEPTARAKSMLAILRGMGMNTDEAIRKLDRRFGQAGIASADGPIYYLFFQRIGAPIFALIGVLELMSPAGTGLDKTLHYVLGFLLIGGGIFGPFLYVQNKIDNRKKRLERAFPDTLDLLLICVESGLALDAALNRVCNELGRAFPEMTEELNRTRLELALINDRVRALMNLGERTDMVAFRSLVAALIQSERFGTSLTDTLRVLSEDFRLLRLSQAEAKAARLPVLLTIPLICFLLPVLLIIILGPAIVSFVRQGSIVTGGA